MRKRILPVLDLPIFSTKPDLNRIRASFLFISKRELSMNAISAPIVREIYSKEELKLGVIFTPLLLLAQSILLALRGRNVLAGQNGRWETNPWRWPWFRAIASDLPVNRL